MTRIAFTGDIGFTRHYKDRVEEDFVDEKLIDFLNDADYTVLNVEGAVADPTHAGLFVHTNSPKAIPQFKKMHGNIWNLANNHTMDAEEPGMLETLRHAKEAGAQTIGAGANLEGAMTPVIIPEDGGIGLFGVVYPKENFEATKDHAGCLIQNQVEEIREVVKNIKAKCRWCVMVVHSGAEFLDIPTKNFRDTYHSYMDMGVDVIVAHHPHVPENYEFYNGKPIFYSLGNFIFDTDYQRVQPHTTEGVLLKLSFTEDEVTFEAQGTKIDRSTGKIGPADLPAIFTCLTEKDYEALGPLACKRYLEHDRKRAAFVKAEEVEGFNEEEWAKRWASEIEKGRAVIGCCLEEVKRYDPEKHDPKYAALEAYLI